MVSAAPRQTVLRLPKTPDVTSYILRKGMDLAFDMIEVATPDGRL